ncbi:MAG: hypothetical protein O6952_00530, partial [Planctomycetota bacterium]|nr:hypothetical protein [Planctomycetota bacterium]
MKSVQTLRVTGWILLALGTLLSPSFADDFVVEFPPPPIHPAGAELESRELAPGVYALVSTKPP